MLNKITSKKDSFSWFKYAISDNIRVGTSMAMDGLISKAILENKIMRQAKFSTSLDLPQITEILNNNGFRQIYEYSSLDQDVREDMYGENIIVEEPTEFGFFLDMDGESIIGFAKEKNYTDINKTVSFYGTSDQIFKWFKETFVQYKVVVEKKDKSSVYMMITTNDGISIQKTGKVGCPFKPSFYSKSVKDSYKFICEDLQKDVPKGKITILSGPPGTGKTFLIRALIGEIGKRCSFVIVPPSLVQKLGEPDMLPALLEHKNEKKPMVLILEDADILVKERMKDSIDAISAALNMGDGILGDVCNIRLLITTNQPITEVDPAMKRPGRLSISCVVGSLNRQEILEAWQEIAGDAPMPEELSEKEFASIAEVFEIYGRG